MLLSDAFGIGDQLGRLDSHRRCQLENGRERRLVAHRRMFCLYAANKKTQQSGWVNLRTRHETKLVANQHQQDFPIAK